MRTTSLVGVTDGNLLHFRGDAASIHDFAHAFDHLQGLSQAPNRNAMDLLEGFLATVRTPPNPYRQLDNSLPNRIVIPGPRGRVGNPNQVAQRNFCAPCHAQNNGGRDSVVRPSPGNTAGNQPAIAPSLRSMYELLGLYYDDPNASNTGYGFIHDGSFDEQTSATLRDNDNLAFMLAFNGNTEGDTHAAVGRQVIVQPGQQQNGLLNQLRGLADREAIGLVAKGMINNRNRAYMYLGSGRYQGDMLAEQFTHAQLLGVSQQANMPLVFTAVPFDSKRRMSIDINDNGILNEDERLGSRLRSVAIANASFESQQFSDGGFALNDIDGWQVNSARAGVWNVASRYYSDEAPEGNNVAFLDVGGTISQTLQETFEPNTHIILSVMVGNAIEPGESSGWEIRLYAGTQLLSMVNNNDVNPPNDSFARVTLSLTPEQLSTHARHYGQRLRIELFDSGGSENAHFDDVRLQIASNISGPVSPPTSSREALITNSSFESQQFNDGGYALNSIDGWQVNSSRGGVWNVASRFYSDEAPEGNNVAFLDTRGTISQTLQERFESNTHLTLSMMVGDQASSGEASGWEIRLYAGDQLLGVANNSDVNPPNDSFARVTLSLTSAQLSTHASHYGQPLRIELFDNGTSENAHFDDVHLTITPDTGMPPNMSNIALGKSATQSSLRHGGVPSRGIDGNTDGNFHHGSVTHTRTQFSPWYQLDLGSSHNINTIRLWNRSDCCVDRLANFYVLVSDRPFVSGNLNEVLAQQGVTAIHHAGVAPRETAFSMNGVGRYVRVQLVNSGILSLAELQVMGASR
ncbi:galactose-binding domain-containing protein [Thalassotalea euphylliae]|nr:discoidin domain-containing protein [Thalassotalea euphylliae]